MERVIAIAKAKGAKYPLTKQWFLETFPEYKESTVSESECNNMEDASIVSLNTAA
ncbi:MAG: hypothetical protein IJH64_06275 [Oscillospiraceae bacterium]|nr:hypothetical protein [Oscillospiraceae bacterium]